MSNRIAIASMFLSAGWAAAQSMPSDYEGVLKTLGKQGDFKANVLKMNIPRNDLKVTIDGAATPTPFGFGGWLAMTKGDGGNDVMMGDLVLLEDEVNPVMSALLDNGLEVTALHNHFFFESPRIFYMHVHGHGKAADLARMAKPAIDLIGHGSPQHQSTVSGGRSNISAGQIDTAKIAKLVGHEGEQAGPVYKITIGRDDINLKEMGATINARMGLNTWAAFFGSDANAEIAGDVAMLAQEVTPVLKALRASGLNVVAIHNHMTGGQPKIYFLHYWGTGTAENLVTGFRSALAELGKHASHTGKLMHESRPIKKPWLTVRIAGCFLRLGPLASEAPSLWLGEWTGIWSRGDAGSPDKIMPRGLAFLNFQGQPPKLARYIGWLKVGRLDALLGSIAFISPLFLMAVAIAAPYVKFGRLAWIQYLFYGVGAAVVAIISQSAYRLAQKTIGRDRFLWLLFAIAVAMITPGPVVTTAAFIGYLVGLLLHRSGS